jgi:hypothetical protein
VSARDRWARQVAGTPDLTDPGRVLCLVLAAQWMGADGFAQVSLRELADVLARSRPAVTKRLDRVVRAGWLASQRGGPGRPTTFVAVIPCASAQVNGNPDAAPQAAEGVAFPQVDGNPGMATQGGAMQPTSDNTYAQVDGNPQGVAIHKASEMAEFRNPGHSLDASAPTEPSTDEERPDEGRRQRDRGTDPVPASGPSSPAAGRGAGGTDQRAPWPPVDVRTEGQPQHLIDKACCRGGTTVLGCQLCPSSPTYWRAA